MKKYMNNIIKYKKFQTIFLLSISMTVIIIISTFFSQYFGSGYDILLRYAWLLDLNTERSVAAWLPGSILFMSGIIMLNNQGVNGTGTRAANLGFLILGLIVILLSADEIGSIHERLDEIAAPFQG